MASSGASGRPDDGSPKSMTAIYALVLGTLLAEIVLAALLTAHFNN